MDFKDQVKQLSDRISKLKEQIQTEEATKTALILPFIQILGYDVFNPLEVIPEMNCDIGTKKGEKIDYCIQLEGEPILLIECKHWGQDLSLHNNQLLRYFHVSKAKFGVLTNGIEYRFYTDLNQPNKMDEVPFLVINLMNLRETHIEELKKFHKSYFNIEEILSTASELKYMGELKKLIATEFSAPSADLVRLWGKQVYDTAFSAKVLEQFTPLVKRALSSYVNDIISERLSVAIQSESATVFKDEEVEVLDKEEADTSRKIVTTEEEMQGYYIVKAILAKEIDPERIFYRDTVSYFTVILDNNNRKNVCRLYLNSPTTKKLVFLDKQKVETAYYIDSVNDLYKYSDQLIESAKG